MKTLQTALGAMFRAPRPADPHRRAREAARRLGAEIGACFEKLPGGGMNVWPPKGCQADPFEGDHYAPDWSDALARVRAYAAAMSTAIPACLQQLAPRTRALLNDSLCNDEVSTDDELQAHWRTELGLTAEQAQATIAYRPRCLVEMFYRPFVETLDTV